jgi:hypothetical protein
VSMARLVVTAVVGEGRSKSEVARDYGVSLATAAGLRGFAMGSETLFSSGVWDRTVRPHLTGVVTPRSVTARAPPRGSHSCQVMRRCSRAATMS